MLKSLLYLCLLLCLASCASLGKRNYDITIASAHAGAKARVNGTTYTLPADVSVPHKKDTLTITLLADSIQKDYFIAPRLRPTALIGNAYYLIFYPLALYVDTQTEKGYYYGSYIYLDANSAQATAKSWWHKPAKKYEPTPKGTVNFTYSLPYANNFYLKPKGLENKENTGFWGFSAGMEYYYKTNRFAKLNVLTATDFFLPVPAAVSGDGTERMGTLSISLTNNFVYNRFSFGYGLNFGRNRWWYRKGLNDYEGDDSPQAGNALLRKRATAALGLQLNGYYRFGKRFYLGLVYNPYLYTVAPTGAFSYQHTISLDFLWKIKL